MSPESNLALAELLTNSRQQQQLSRETLSGLAGVSVSFIRDAERDPASCSLGKLHRLCAALGLNWQLSEAGQRLWPLNARLATQPGNALATGVSFSKDSP